MRIVRPQLAAALLLLALALAACGGQPAAPAASAVPAEAPTQAAAQPATDSNALNLDNWESVVAAARGQTVNWYIWGGSESINRFVDEFYGKPLMERYGVTLNRVPLADTVDAVNQVLSEKEAGVAAGAVDVIWINGENFLSLKQADMLLPDWSRKLPNAELVDWENPAIYLDFGEPVEGYESPWSSAQFQLIYDSARMGEEELPRSYAGLLEWAKANPGRFTYIAPGPGAFQGTRFVKGALFELSGGADQWLAFEQDLWDEHAPQLWAYLNEQGRERAAQPVRQRRGRLQHHPGDRRGRAADHGGAGARDGPRLRLRRLHDRRLQLPGHPEERAQSGRRPGAGQPDPGARAAGGADPARQRLRPRLRHRRHAGDRPGPAQGA
jgi:putative spermidine/putrescine transport system substrate-binding protein